MKKFTCAEKIIWEKLKKGKVRGFKFKRQHKVLYYIIDFYCPKVKLAIEVDGGYHLSNYQKAYDKIRQAEIEQLNIKFLRFTNDQVINFTSQVIKEISEYIQKLSLP